MRGLIFFLFLLLLGWMAGSTWCYVCEIKDLCGEGFVKSKVKTPTVSFDHPLEVNYGGATVFSFDENLRFVKNGIGYSLPGKIQSALDSIASYLKNNPNRELELTGLYQREETNGTDFSNLGLGRADALKKELVNRGVKPERIINSFSVREEMLFRPADSLVGGVLVNLLEASLSGSEKPEMRYIYFDHASPTLSMDNDLRAYITRTIQYLNQNPKTRLQLIGHTDNEGNSNYNQKLGRQRAETLKGYFKQFGADHLRMRVNSKGETNPIESNKTEEGRRKNRRVEVKILD